MSSEQHNGDDAPPSSAQQHHQLPPSILGQTSRYRPSRRRKSQTYQQHTHSCNSLYSLTAAATASAATSDAARERPELGSSTLSAAAQLQSASARGDGRSVPNVNFYIPPDENGVEGAATAIGRQSTIDRARVNLNLSLKNVCAPAPRSSADGGSGHADGSVLTSISTTTNSSGAVAKDLLETHEADADADADAAGKASGVGLIGSLRSWADKFRRWRSCVSSSGGGGTGDRKQSMSASMAAAGGGSGRGRMASVASVFGAEKSQQSTSSRILRAFSHVGETDVKCEQREGQWAFWGVVTVGGAVSFDKKR